MSKKKMVEIGKETYRLDTLKEKGKMEISYEEYPSKRPTKPLMLILICIM